MISSCYMAAMVLWLLPTLLTSLSILLPNLLILFKITTRPILHSLFNVSLSPMLAAFAIFGPILAAFYFKLMMVERSAWNCSRFMEARTVIHQSLINITLNLLCRFFYILHAEKGLLVRLGVDNLEFEIRSMAG